MRDAFGVERTDIAKGWKGEPGDKRNTKYAAAWGTSPVVGGVYTIYRQTKTGKQNRAESIAAKKRHKVHKADLTPAGKRGDKRNTKYAAAGIGGGAVGMAAGPFVGRQASGMTKEQLQAKNGEAFVRFVAGDEKGAKKTLNSAKMRRYMKARKASKWGGAAAGAGAYAAYRQTKGAKENREDSIKEKKYG